MTWVIQPFLEVDFSFLTVVKTPKKLVENKKNYCRNVPRKTLNQYCNNRCTLLKELVRKQIVFWPDFQPTFQFDQICLIFLCAFYANQGDAQSSITENVDVYGTILLG